MACLVCPYMFVCDVEIQINMSKFNGLIIKDLSNVLFVKDIECNGRYNMESVRSVIKAEEHPW